MRRDEEHVLRKVLIADRYATEKRTTENKMGRHVPVRRGNTGLRVGEEMDRAT